MKKVRKAAVNRGFKPTKKSATTADILNQMIATCGESNIDIRDRAVLLFAFSSGGRRSSEVSSASLNDIYQVPDGYIYSLGATKSDQLGKEDLKVPILGTAGKHYEMDKPLDDNDGPLFRAIAPNGSVTKNGIIKQNNYKYCKKAS